MVFAVLVLIMLFEAFGAFVSGSAHDWPLLIIDTGGVFLFALFAWLELNAPRHYDPWRRKRWYD